MTHGRGKKAGRGAGLRGGKGNAGLLKHKYMHMIKYMPNHFGRHGFKRPKSIITREKIINVGQLDEKFSGKKTIDLQKEGYDKLLGGGIPVDGLKVRTKSATEKAIEKIKKHGGEVTIIE
jgi:large subunit ribosomal protein L15